MKPVKRTSEMTKSEISFWQRYCEHLIDLNYTGKVGSYLTFAGSDLFFHHFGLPFPSVIADKWSASLRVPRAPIPRNPQSR